MAYEEKGYKKAEDTNVSTKDGKEFQNKGRRLMQQMVSFRLNVLMEFLRPNDQMTMDNSTNG